MPIKDRVKRNEYARRHQQLRGRRNRAELIALLGGKCIICGSTNNLEFHHKDPTTKRFTIAAALQGRKERITEALKCELRCTEHHYLAHEKPCGSASDKYRTCPCDVCRDTRRRYNAKWMAAWRAAGKDKSRKNFGVVAQ